ncbi:MULTISPECIES: hypothetical protein [unclassified Pseudoalteromonas]|uniref:hypothetical protein n=1 Tax=unclassified Pseudoalteromonas TaxID=194690 RepID=UPI0004645134|nr:MULTISPECIES: hypothetical protein [unclassified Pseudoalteromonas]
MSETEAYLQFIAMICIFLCMPYCGYVFFNLSKWATAKLFPSKYLKIEITNETGQTRIVKIDIENDEELVEKLLCARGSFEKQ